MNKLSDGEWKLMELLWEGVPSQLHPPGGAVPGAAGPGARAPPTPCSAACAGKGRR